MRKNENENKLKKLDKKILRMKFWKRVKAMKTGIKQK